uniref:Uncharacterized protein n=1 Tax=Solanum lycopersicum TaxID=4081 RepID=A0A3Q7IU04_SOLLC
MDPPLILIFSRSFTVTICISSLIFNFSILFIKLSLLIDLLSNQVYEQNGCKR